MKNFKNFAKTYEQGVLDLSDNLINKKIGKHVRLMPDTHVGKGSAIGFTGILTDRLAPEVVGVDIGCGLMLSRFLAKKIDFMALDRHIKENIPNGYDKYHKHDTHHKDIKGITKEEFVERFIKPLSLELRENLKDAKWFYRQLGSLGSGNHFIEVDKDTENNMYLTVHSGSRGFGAWICQFWQEKAKKERFAHFETKINELREKLKLVPNEEKENFVKEIVKVKGRQNSKETAYLVGELKDKYLNDMRVAQKYAVLNRKLMIESINERFKLEFWFDSVHNFIGDDNIIRKGATSARKGELLVIPLNMADGVLICEGKGNEDWNFSAPHGAGRLMSRTRAFKELSLDEAKKQMENVFSSTLNMKTLDEAPKVYKDSKEIIEAIEPTVKIVKNIKSIYNFKGI